MTWHQFIISRQSHHRVLRHVLFWAIIYLPMIGISCVPLFEGKWKFIPSFEKIFYWQFIYLRYLVVDILFSYLVAYYLIPTFFLKKRYTAFAIYTALAVVGAYLVSAVFALVAYSTYRLPLMMDLWKHTQVFLNSGAIIRCGMFLFVLGVKNYYVQMEERIDLLKETANAELQLLKAQVHPHFLFNTINNIYSFMLTRSPEASQLIARLKATMHYMITDCESATVPLSKEISMLKDYIGLERVRYGNRLRINLRFPEDLEHYHITPLILVPFVENAFKHGASKMLVDPWIIVQMDIGRDRLRFLVSNGKPPEYPRAAFKSGIGLRNVRKRLELLYPDRYLLKTEETETTYSVELIMPITADSSQHSKQFENQAALLTVL